MTENYVPFLLKLNLSSPFHLSAPLTLDGLLSHAVFCEKGLMDEATIDHIPLARGEMGIFKASALHIPKSAFYVRGKFNRVASLRDLKISDFSPNVGKGKNARYGQVDTQRGPYKTVINSYSAHDAREVVFYAVGDPDEVVRLISNYVPGVGKCANSGAGQIESASWSLLENDYSWITPKGTPARPLPSELWNQLSDSRYETEPMSYQVPYSKSKRVASVFPETILENWGQMG